MIYAKAGERVVTPEGRYLATLARDLDTTEKRWSTDAFIDTQMDLDHAAERLPVTSWLLDRMRAARG